MNPLVKAMLVLLCTGWILLGFGAYEATAQNQRYAQCDVCGYCQGADHPGTWDSCVQCMYEDLVEEESNNLTPVDGQDLTETAVENIQENNLTLLVDPATGEPPEPASGRYFTVLGCLNTGADTFTDQGAVAGVANFLLQYIIYTIAGALAFLYLIYGSYIIITAKGDPMRLQQGKTIVIRAIIGIIFLFLLGLIINFISEYILRLQVGSGEASAQPAGSPTPMPTIAQQEVTALEDEQFNAIVDRCLSGTGGSDCEVNGNKIEDMSDIEALYKELYGD